MTEALLSMIVSWMSPTWLHAGWGLLDNGISRLRVELLEVPKRP